MDSWSTVRSGKAKPREACMYVARAYLYSREVPVPRTMDGQTRQGTAKQAEDGSLRGPLLPSTYQCYRIVGKKLELLNND